MTHLKTSELTSRAWACTRKTLLSSFVAAALFGFGACAITADFWLEVMRTSALRELLSNNVWYDAGAPSAELSFASFADCVSALGSHAKAGCVSGDKLRVVMAEQTEAAESWLSVVVAVFVELGAVLGALYGLLVLPLLAAIERRWPAFSLRDFENVRQARIKASFARRQH